MIDYYKSILSLHQFFVMFRNIFIAKFYGHLPKMLGLFLAKRLVSEAIENVQARARERGGDVDADMGGEAPMEQDRDLRERLGYG